MMMIQATFAAGGLLRFLDRDGPRATEDFVENNDSIPPAPDSALRGLVETPGSKSALALGQDTWWKFKKSYRKKCQADGTSYHDAVACDIIASRLKNRVSMEDFLDQDWRAAVEEHREELVVGSTQLLDTFKWEHVMTKVNKRVDSLQKAPGKCVYPMCSVLTAFGSEDHDFQLDAERFSKYFQRHCCPGYRHYNKDLTLCGNELKAKIVEFLGDEQAVKFLFLSAHGRKDGRVKLKKGVFLTPEEVVANLAKETREITIILESCYAGTWEQQVGKLWRRSRPDTTFHLFLSCGDDKVSRSTLDLGSDYPTWLLVPLEGVKKSMHSIGEPIHDCLETKLLLGNRLSDVRVTFSSKNRTDRNCKRIKAAKENKGRAAPKARTEERMLTKEALTSEARDRFNSFDKNIEKILDSGHHEFFG